MRAQGIWSICAQATGLFAIAALVRWLQIDHHPHYDEFYHLLAGHSWATEESLRIADGAYVRASLYTKFLGWWFGLFGEGIVIARIPALLAGSLWVVGVYLWTRMVAGNAAGWIAALLFCFAPGAIWLSQFNRFYAFHAILFWAGAAGVYMLCTRRLRPMQTAALALGTAACFGLALHFQVTTIIGLISLGVWAAYVLSVAWFQSSLSRRVRPLGAGGAVAAGLLALAGLFYSGLGWKLVNAYRSAAFWNSGNQNAELFYYHLFLEQYPTLWPLLPVAALVAIAARPEPGLFATVVFGTAFVLHSFAGNKLEHYFYYAVPFFFVLWGIALAHVAPGVGRFLRSVTDRALAVLPIPQRGWLHRGGRWAIFVFAAVFLAIANPAAIDAFNKVSQPASPDRTAAWTAAGRMLAPLLDKADVVVTTDDLRALYFLGRYDVLLNKKRLMETSNPVDFKRDPRTGRPIISTPEAFAFVLRCHDTGLYITEEEWWGDPNFGGAAAVDLLTTTAKPIRIPGRFKLHVYSWDNGGEPRPASCASIPVAQNIAR